MPADVFSFYDMVKGDLRATVHASHGQLIVREANTKRYLHSFALRLKGAGTMLAVRDNSAIEPGENIEVIEAQRLRPGAESDGYRAVPLRFGPLLLAIQRGEEFLEIE